MSVRDGSPPAGWVRAMDFARAEGLNASTVRERVRLGRMTGGVYRTRVGQSGGPDELWLDPASMLPRARQLDDFEQYKLDEEKKHFMMLGMTEGEAALRAAEGMIPRLPDDVLARFRAEAHTKEPAA